MEVWGGGGSSEMLVTVHQSTEPHTPEDNNLHSRFSKNHRSRLDKF
jgi:hypothetical protein